MKNLVTFVALLAVGFGIWKYHSGKEAAKVASENKRPAAPAAGQAIAISRSLEPWVPRLFAKLDAGKPEDLVPPLTVIRGRIMDAKSRVEAAKQPIYDQALAVVATMIRAGDERTKALEIQLQAKRSANSSLDSKKTVMGSKEFLAQSTQRRWDDASRELKPLIEQGLTGLRTSEQTWNSKLDASAPVDSFDIDKLDKVLVTVDAKDVTKNSLDRGKYNMTRTMYPWRNEYYQRYGVSPVR